MRIYKGNDKNTGLLLSFKSNNENLFINITEQAGYNEEKQIALFSDGGSFTVKSNQLEVAKILDSFENKESVLIDRKNGYSSSLDFKKIDNPKGPYILNAQHKSKDKDVNRRVGIKNEELFLIKSYLNWFLNNSFVEPEEYVKTKTENKKEEAKGNEEPDPFGGFYGDDNDSEDNLGLREEDDDLNWDSSGSI